MKSTKYIRLALAVASTLLLGGCSSEDPKKSDNIAALNEIIDIQFPVKSGRWEAFSSPETPGIVLGPGEYITLIAEVRPDKDHSVPNKEPTGEIYIVPEAARPWLTDQFHQLLYRNKDSTANLSTQGDCHRYVTTLKKTNRQAEGFACEISGRVLIYLTMASARQIAESLK